MLLGFRSCCGSVSQLYVAWIPQLLWVCEPAVCCLDSAVVVGL